MVQDLSKLVLKEFKKILVDSGLNVKKLVKTYNQPKDKNVFQVLNGTFQEQKDRKQFKGELKDIISKSIVKYLENNDYITKHQVAANVSIFFDKEFKPEYGMVSLDQAFTTGSR